jgi:hypothetical protein
MPALKLAVVAAAYLYILKEGRLYKTLVQLLNTFK